MIKIVGVRFRSAGKVYYFDPKDLQLRMGDHVIAETSKGLDYGIVSTCMKMVDEELVQQPLRALVRKTTPEDEERIEALKGKEKEALKVCREKVREHELDMKMVNAEYSFDGTKVLFYFTADGRVDFRSLVKDLAGIFHVRIELRQIGVRDETRMLGGIGICGRELCCATFLREFQPVSIKMAKEQNLSLNPTKISGTCGRLMCCLKNEEDTYEYLNARMPKLGEEAVTADGQIGKVVELDVLHQRVRVLFEEEDTKEMEVFPVEQLTFRPKKKKDPSQQGKKARAEKGEKSAKAEKPEKGEKPEKNERPGKGEKPEKGERPGKGEKPEKGERPGKGEKPEKGERPGKGEKPGKGERSGKGERPDRSERFQKGERSEKPAREENGEKPERQNQRRRRNPRPDQESRGTDFAGDNEEKTALKKHKRYRPRPKTEGRPQGNEKPDGSGSV